MSNNLARNRLARIRCVFDCIEAIRNGKELPDALCFIPGRVERKLQSERSSSSLAIRENPSMSATRIGEIPHKIGTRITTSGEDYWNDEGRWLQLDSATLKKYCNGDFVCGWLFIHSRDRAFKDNVDVGKVKGKKKSKKCGFDSWEQAVESCYSLHNATFSTNSLAEHGDVVAMKKLKTPPPNWNLEADEELSRFINQNNIFLKETMLGNISQFVEAIEVSSETSTVATITDGDSDTYWESDGSQGQHWIRLKMKPGTIVKRLFINVDSSDDNYMPSCVHTLGGEAGNLKQLHEVSIDSNTTGDVLVLEDMVEHCPIIEIWIKECKDDGIDTRIHGIKLVSSEEKEPGLNADLFKKKNNIIRFPKLEHVSADLLYQRARCLLRFVALLDSVLHFILPSWQFTAGSYTGLEIIRQLLPLSRRRLMLITQFLKDSQSCITLPRVPTVVINRHAAAEHRLNPMQDPDGKQSVFYQLYEAVKPEKCGITLDFRWSSRYEQWWECKFISEGIIDQGGGFRDSLCDIAEELCPSSPESLLPLPFFIRSPNQMQDTSNLYRDGYIPNPSCHLYAQYEWLGMLMGAHLRGKECLLLSLPKFVWKQLLGEKVSWLHDFVTVDSASVKWVTSLIQMDKEKFEEQFADALTYMTTLSDGSVYELLSNSEDKVVTFEDCQHYAKLLQSARMKETQKQIDCIRNGLLKVVPKSLLDLLTWQELELKVCGNPNVGVDDLRKTTSCEDLPASDDRVKYFWKAMENFTNEDRSRFLRFVTGRRRLPATMILCANKDSAPVDSLPEAATCSSTLFLPTYTSCKIAEEKLRYAAYNCVSIDTDSQPWDE